MERGEPAGPGSTWTCREVGFSTARGEPLDEPLVLLRTGIPGSGAGLLVEVQHTSTAERLTPLLEPRQPGRDFLVAGARIAVSSAGDISHRLRRALGHARRRRGARVPRHGPAGFHPVA